MLREQEYMMAAETTGISAFKKIFKHLVPNAMPQLIVMQPWDWAESSFTNRPYPTWGWVFPSPAPPGDP